MEKIRNRQISTKYKTTDVPRMVTKAIQIGIVAAPKDTYRVAHCDRVRKETGQQLDELK